VTVFTREGCPFCAKAKSLLKDAGIVYDELVLNKDYRNETLRAVAGQDSVPQVFINGKLVGGSDNLEAWLASNK
jgi:glutaredoxin-like protein